MKLQKTKKYETQENEGMWNTSQQNNKSEIAKSKAKENTYFS